VANNLIDNLDANDKMELFNKLKENLIKNQLIWWKFILINCLVLFLIIEIYNLKCFKLWKLNVYFNLFKLIIKIVNFNKNCYFENFLEFKNWNNL